MMKIAVIGTGIAGLGAAYVLSRRHEVVLFDENGPAGGPHEHGSAPTGSRSTRGFIVHNVANYPSLTRRFFRELGVETQSSEMSFAMTCGCGLEWSSRRPWRAASRPARPRDRALPAHGRARCEAEGKTRTVRAFVTEHGYSESFRWHYLVPMTSALWSTAPAEALEFPAAHAIDFFRNHSMLGLRRDRWRTVRGGSRTYVRAVLEHMRAPVHLGLPVRSITRVAGGVELRTDDGEARPFGAVVVATRRPRALALLADRSPTSAAAGSVPHHVPIERSCTPTSRLLPRGASNRSSWNYQSPGCGVLAPRPTMTYLMNRLQKLDAGRASASPSTAQTRSTRRASSA